MGGNNLKLWESVEQTDPSFTRSGQIGLTSINAQYLFRKATEAFGVVGIGWGYEITEERFDDGKPYCFQQGKESDKHTVEGLEKNHTVKINFWAMIDGEKSIVSHYGHTKYLYKSKYGLTVDEEAPKKSLTDALKKCLSLYGFAGDIHLGHFDDADYVNEQKTKHEIEKDQNSEELLAAKRDEFFSWLERCQETYKKVPNEEALNVLFIRDRNQCHSKCRALRFSKAETYINKLKDAKEARQLELKADQFNEGEKVA